MRWLGKLGLILNWIGVIIWIVTLDISCSYCKAGLYWSPSWKLLGLVITGYLAIATGFFLNFYGIINSNDE